MILALFAAGLNISVVMPSFSKRYSRKRMASSSFPGGFVVFILMNSLAHLWHNHVPFHISFYLSHKNFFIYSNTRKRRSIKNLEQTKKTD